MEKKICVFTQTYGDNRKELFEYHNLDLLDIKFRNNFNLNLYSFHNSSEDYKNDILQYDYFKKIDNLKIISYDNISYTQSWKLTLEKFQELGMDYVIFLQDDCFSISTESKISYLIDYIKNNDFNLLNIERNSGIFKLDNCEKKYSEGIDVYNTTSNNYANICYSFDDGPFVGKISYLIDMVYDDVYFRMSSIWSGELYLHNKIQKNPIERFVTNGPSHKRFNIVGKNTADRDKELSNLKNYLNI